jgi:ADP-heptose:LPS heptosyltransferase
MYKTKKLYWSLLLLIDIIGNMLFFWKKFRKFPVDPKKILVIRLDHMGDMILTSSFFRNLKNAFPNANLEVLCRSSTKPIAEMIPFIDKINVLNVPWFSRNASVSLVKMCKFISINKKEYDLVFELHSDLRNIILAFFLGKYSLGFGIRGFGFLLNKTVKWDQRLKHIVDRNHDLLKPIKINITNKKLSLKVDKQLVIKIKKLIPKNNRKKVLINLGVGAKERDWGLENFKELTSLLLEKTNYTIILVDSNTKKSKILLKNIKSKRLIDFSNKLNLKELVALTSIVDIVFGLESMNIHLATALGKKIIYVHSSVTYIQEWGPYCKDFIVFQKKPVNLYYSSKKAIEMIRSIKAEKVMKAL